MTKKQRVDRLNSLLKEVISEVVTKEVRNPKVSHLVTVKKNKKDEKKGTKKK